VRNGWTVKQAESGLLSRWSERPENDRMLNAVAVGFWQIAVGQLVASTG